MSLRIAVIGGSISGLAVSLFLARRGHQVVMAERDAAITPPDAVTAASWRRRATPQAAHSHAFLARTRAILAAEAPGVLAALDDAGARSAVLTHALPESLVGFEPAPDDGDLIVCNARRSVFEWVLRRAVEAEAGIELRLGTGVDGIEITDHGVPRVRGVRTRAGPLAADVVIDASGRRSVHAAPPRREVPCGISYLTRFYQLRESEPLVPNRGFTHGASFDRYSCLVFPADNGAFSITFGVLPDDRSLRVLRNVSAFGAAVAAIAAVAPWTDPEVSVPTSDVAVMASLHNLLRPPAADQPLGLHAIGDACCVTNPAHTRGVTLALLSAQRLADIITEHPRDLSVQAAAMAAFVDDELALWVEDSIGQDAARLARWAPDETIEPPRWRATLTNGEAHLAAQRDPGAWRAFTRLQNTLARPDEVLEDPALIDTAARVRASGWAPATTSAPDHDELALLARRAAGA